MSHSEGKATIYYSLRSFLACMAIMPYLCSPKTDVSWSICAFTILEREVAIEIENEDEL